MANSELMLTRNTPPRPLRGQVRAAVEVLGCEAVFDAATVSTVRVKGLHIPSGDGTYLRCFTYVPAGVSTLSRSVLSLAAFAAAGGCASCLTQAGHADPSPEVQSCVQAYTSLVSAYTAAALPTSFSVGALATRRQRIQIGLRNLAALVPVGAGCEARDAATTVLQELYAEVSARLDSDEVNQAIRSQVCVELLGVATPDTLAGLDDTPTLVGLGKNLWMAGRLANLIEARYQLLAEHALLLEVPRFVADYLLVTANFQYIKRSAGRVALPQTAPAVYSSEEVAIAGALFDPSAESSMRSLAHALESARAALAA